MSDDVAPPHLPRDWKYANSVAEVFLMSCFVINMILDSGFPFDKCLFVFVLVTHILHWDIDTSELLMLSVQSHDLWN